MQEEPLRIQFGDIESSVPVSEDESLDSMQTVQNKIIQCIQSHEMEPPEVFNILVNSTSDPEQFSQLTTDSFSDLSWWRGLVLRVEQQDANVTDMKEPEPNLDESIHYFDVNLNVDEMTFVIDRAHLSETIEEVCQIIDVSDVECSILATILDATTITQDQMDLWTDYSGSSPLFRSVDGVRHSLNQMISYAATPPEKHGEFVTEKMKTIGHVLNQPDAADKYDVPNILLYLASHGVACNVLKEVAIEMTYSLLTGSAEEFVRRQSLKNTILRGLRECRYNIVEELFSSFPSTVNNIHGVATLNNYLSENVPGIPKIEDPNLSGCGLPSGWQTGLVDKFYEAYTTERCLKALKSCVKEKKIGYQQIVEWFEVRAPPSEKYDFLARVFDADSGAISDSYLSWMLADMHIFEMVPSPVSE